MRTARLPLGRSRRPTAPGASATTRSCPVHCQHISRVSVFYYYYYLLPWIGCSSDELCASQVCGDARWTRYLEIAGAEDAADGARRGELKEFAGGGGRGGGERRQRRQLVRGRRRRRVEAAATTDAAERHVGQLQVHRERVRADAPLDAVVVVVRRRERGGVAGRRRRREGANIAAAVEVPAGRGDLRRDGDGQRGGGGEARGVVVHEGVAVGGRGRGGGLAEHGFWTWKASGLCADCGLGLGFGGSLRGRGARIRSGGEVLLQSAAASASAGRCALKGGGVTPNTKKILSQQYCSWECVCAVRSSFNQ